MRHTIKVNWDKTFESCNRWHLVMSQTDEKEINTITESNSNFSPSILLQLQPSYSVQES
ncbi:hypothetical protein DFA_03529 [Cavenderia fasciculata]|uniref:Uncharacterized protein n=1 Tax=Cavenderia fasciculata TaxID=261658 RepID=F4PHU7_CACFS|nr:uncharacterized protein DFA_03529 [Cavenderia fasciculata]EGG25281.1 hypothetical protein DFA_03529 [Cavenderia fasciculata]|eukprot:XP_004363132.1 hypothetical protein DFA_03529 [Cavenderia fasciculata]